MRNRNIWILLGAAVVILLLLAASRLFAGPGAVVTDSAPAMGRKAAALPPVPWEKPSMAPHSTTTSKRRHR